MYSPLLFGTSAHAWFGGPDTPAWWPGSLPYSAALLILWAPGGFRMTCYYYRGAYYKAFWADPPACAVGEPRKGYRGERKFPLTIQNIHRYFLSRGGSFVLSTTWEGDVVPRRRRHRGAPGAPVVFGIGVGTIVLAINAVLSAATRSAVTRCGIWSAA
jgi:hypothetical protein